jgi:hypothetical protein
LGGRRRMEHSAPAQYPTPQSPAAHLLPNGVEMSPGRSPGSSTARPAQD